MADRLRRGTALAVKEILRIGHPLLRGTADSVTEFNTAALDQLVADMLDTMRYANGAGLAAPQLGVPKRVVIFGCDDNPRYPDAPSVPLTVLINPQIVISDPAPCYAWEGCLSVPGMRGLVPRPRAIRYRARDAAGHPIEAVAEGFHARVVLHECDHLDGMLYPRRVEDLRCFGYEQEMLDLIRGWPDSPPPASAFAGG